MHKKQPDFRRLRTALLCGQPERVPLFELAVDMTVKEKFLGRPIVGLEDEIDFYREAGYDYIKLSPLVDFNPGKAVPREGSRLTQRSDDRGQRRWNAGNTGVITSLAEFEAYQWPKLEEVDYSPFEQVQKLLPDGMQIVGQYGDIFTYTWDLMGFETFSISLVENPELVAIVFQKVGSIVYHLFETMASFDKVGALCYSDDIAFYSGPLCSPTVFRTHLFPWMKKIGQVCRERNLPFIYHSDGKLWELMEDLLDCGVNALQPIEPKTMDIREVKQRYGRRLCLIGNVDVDLLARGTPEQVQEKTLELIREVAPGGGYCLGSGNTVPEYVPVENYRAMVETAWEFGRYPIG